MLWLRMSGSASSTVRRAPGSPLKSGMRTSTLQPGTRARMSRIVRANIPAPPSRRSSLSTDVQLGREPVGDGAVGAVARADVPQDEEGGGPAFPAVADVGAAGLLAHRVEGLGPHDAHELVKGRARREPDLEPLGTPRLPRHGRPRTPASPPPGRTPPAGA